MRPCVRLAVLAAVLAALAPPAQPCSICRCGDPTFNALGKGGYLASGFRLALDWERFDKREGDPAVEAEELVENRITALAAYGFNDRVALYARLPLSLRDFSQIEGGHVDDAFTTSGLSDPELYAQLRLFQSKMTPDLGRRNWLALVGGVKTALGQNDYEIDGERVDEHAQPGTGSTDVFGGLSAVRLLGPRSSLFTSVQHRHTGTNDTGYRYGSVWLANLAAERKLGSRVDGVLELNFRHSSRDTEHEAAVENTGGSVLYLTPRLLVDLGGGVVLRGALQIPIVHDLYGVQQERVVVNVGLSFMLGGGSK